MYLNLSLYYLKILGNYCQAIYFYRKVAELNLSLREKFSFVRLRAQISKTLVEKLKPPNEQCNELENLDVSMYFKYEELSENFFDEINIDVNLSLDFWKEFQSSYKEPLKRLDFNKIFELTDKIGKTKKSIEVMWSELLQIYSGVNNFFELYSDYVEQINDDDLKKRDLEGLRRKNDASNEHINNKFYSLLFNKNTGIIIANGDKGKEGIIEFANKEIENIFKYKTFDLKGMNLTTLMPKMYEKEHSKYIENYFKIGQKKVIDKPDLKVLAKDKDNSIIKIGVAVKLFPILNDNVLFAGLINKENIDDIIYLDDKFNIQGMSLKLMKILNIANKNLFQEKEIPFYVICKKFVNFYSIFLQRAKKEIDPDKDLQDIESKEKEKDQEKKEDIHENIEINENVELEYEIKLPQFLVDFAEKSQKEDHENMVKLISTNKNSVIESDIQEEEYEEDELLIENEEKKK
jgi:PAS domain S-box-containing protein